MSDTLNLDDFNFENKNIINSEENKKSETKKKTKKSPTKQKLEKKIQVNLTTEEYDKLYQDYENSGYSSFAGYVRMQLKNIKFI